MKRFVIFAILSVFLFGCNINSETTNISESTAGNTNNESKHEIDNNIKYSEGVYSNKDWDNYEFTLDNICIPNVDTAVNLTDVFLKNLQRQDNTFIGYVLLSVFYDTEDCIWIVTYAESNDYPSSCISFALRADNAEVIKMWIGE